MIWLIVRAELEVIAAAGIVLAIFAGLIYAAHTIADTLRRSPSAECQQREPSNCTVVEPMPGFDWQVSGL